jgi:hypothetical protein
MKVVPAPSVTKTNSGRCDEDNGSTGKEDGRRRRVEAEERAVGMAQQSEP